MDAFFDFITAMAALSIPITAIALAFRQTTQKNKIRELELQKEIAELELKKQDNMLKLLENENHKLYNEINNL